MIIFKLMLILGTVNCSIYTDQISKLEQVMEYIRNSLPNVGYIAMAGGSDVEYGSYGDSQYAKTYSDRINGKTTGKNGTTTSDRFLDDEENLLPLENAPRTHNLDVKSVNDAIKNWEKTFGEAIAKKYNPNNNKTFSPPCLSCSYYSLTNDLIIFSILIIFGFYCCLPMGLLLVLQRQKPIGKNDDEAGKKVDNNEKGSKFENAPDIFIV